jgi:hypothetical protein
VDRFRIALVQPPTVPPPGDKENIAAAIGLSEQWQRPEPYDSLYPRPPAPPAREAAE